MSLFLINYLNQVELSREFTWEVKVALSREVLHPQSPRQLIEGVWISNDKTSGRYSQIPENYPG